MCVTQVPAVQRMRVFRSPVKLSTQLQHEIYQSLQTIRLELIPRITGYCYTRLIASYQIFTLCGLVRLFSLFDLLMKESNGPSEPYAKWCRIAFYVMTSDE